MNQRHLGVVAMGMLALAACSKDQSYPDAMKILCDKDAASTAMKGATGAKAIAAYADAMGKKVSNADGKRVLADLTAAPPSGRYLVLMKAANETHQHGCLAQGLFNPQPFTPDPGDDATRAWAMQLGDAATLAIMGKPADPAFLGDDPGSDIRKLADPDRFVNQRREWLNAYHVIAVVVQLAVEKKGQVVQFGFVAWDDARATEMGNPLQWTRIRTGPSYRKSDPDGTAPPSALAHFIDRTLACLRPPGCQLPFRSSNAADVGGTTADELLTGNDFGAAEDLVGEADDANTGWKLVDAQVMVLSAMDPISDHNVQTTGSWIETSLVSGGGKLYLGPADWADPIL